jgi:hypothetical protein
MRRFSLVAQTADESIAPEEERETEEVDDGASYTDDHDTEEVVIALPERLYPKASEVCSYLSLLMIRNESALVLLD